MFSKVLKFRLRTVLSFQLLFLLKICDSNGINENNPFDFKMFENFGLTKDVFIREQKLIKDLRDLKGLLESELTLLKTKMLEMRIPGELPNENTTSLLTLGGVKDGVKVEADSSDPRGALALLKRSAITLPAIRNMLKFRLQKSREHLANVTSITEEFPHEEDFTGAVRGLMLLQDTYDFNITEATKGTIDFVTTQKLRKILHGRERLDPHDLVILADHAYNKGYYTNAVEFLKVANRTMMERKETWDKTMLKLINQMKKRIVDLNNQYINKKQSVIGGNYKVYPYLLDGNLEMKKKQPKVVTENRLMMDWSSEFTTEVYFRKLCGLGGPLMVTPPPTKPNKCGYLHHFNPYLRLGPFKVEVINRSPYMSVLHDLFTEEEIKWMIDYSIPRLSRKREYGSDNSDVVASHEYKTGNKVKIVHKTVQCWITDVYHEGDEDEEVARLENKDFLGKGIDKNFTVYFPIMFKLAKRLELASMMNITDKYSSTPFQTTNYGLGGLCEKHMDPHGYIEGREIPVTRRNLILSGDMYATTMGWLDDVDAGGGTAFTSPHVEKVIMPTRGSVALWYNLDRKGHRDLRATHGGCPILKGSKWILNKWIYYYNQFQQFPCSTDPKAYLDPPQGYYRNPTPSS